jgi:hypothetical protein
MWGGSTFQFMDKQAAVNQAFESFNIAAPTDPYAALIVAYVYLQSADMFGVSVDLEYGKPIATPPIFQNFTAITPIQSTLRITNLVNLTVEFNNSNPGGFRSVSQSFSMQFLKFC